MDQFPSSSSSSCLTPADRLETAKRYSGAVCLTDVAPARATWLWPGRIPLGNVTLLVSDPGVGKSLIALDIAARVSTGRPWPDDVGPPSRGGLERDNDADPSSAADPTPGMAGCRVPVAAPTGSVLLLNIEDHFATTIRPRLEALGADCSRIFALTYIPGDDLMFEAPRLFALNRDLARLAYLVSSMPDCRLVILDPITAFLGDTSDQCNSDVWKLLSSLASLARKNNLAVLVVSHLRKKEGAAIHRAMGSLAFVAAARAAWTIAKDPAGANKRLLLPLKNNLAPAAKGLAFTIESDESTRAPVVRWLPGDIEASADTILTPNRLAGRPDDERKFAIRWLSERLATGPLPSRAVRRAADANGISSGTLRRAFRELGAVAFQPNDVLHGPWMWKLPGSDAQNTMGEFCATDQFTDEFAESANP